MTPLKSSYDRLTLPWPPKELSPNYAGHWAPQASAKKKYRFAVWALALQAKWKVPEEGKIRLEIEFYPPDKRKGIRTTWLAHLRRVRMVWLTLGGSTMQGLIAHIR